MLINLINECRSAENGDVMKRSTFHCSAPIRLFTIKICHYYYRRLLLQLVYCGRWSNLRSELANACDVNIKLRGVSKAIVAYLPCPGFVIAGGCSGFD